MSGDVFGNGMLLSRHIQLVAAFDHRHIFLDPDPDPASEFRRARAPVQAAALVMGRLRRQADLRGRRHLSRAAPSRSPLSPEVKRALGISADALTPTELVNAILKAPVDLLYNGGIGTYVKASERIARAGRRPRQRRPARRRPRAALQGRSSKAATSAARSSGASNTRSQAGASIPTRSTIRPASTPPITKSTSRSCSGCRSPTAN